MRQHASLDLLKNGKEIYQLAVRMWDSIGDKRSVRLLGLAVSNLERASNQFPLFSWPSKLRPLWEAMDQVNDKYGEFTLTWGSLHQSPE